MLTIFVKFLLIVSLLVIREIQPETARLRWLLVLNLEWTYSPACFNLSPWTPFLLPIFYKEVCILTFKACMQQNIKLWIWNVYVHFCNGNVYCRAVDKVSVFIAVPSNTCIHREDFLRFISFSIYGHICSAQGPEPLSQGMWISQLR